MVLVSGGKGNLSATYVSLMALENYVNIMTLENYVNIMTLENYVSIMTLENCVIRHPFDESCNLL